MNCPACQVANEPGDIACQACGQALGAPTQVVVTVDLAPGALFHQRYRIEGPLGRGGMGMVYRAHDTTLDETVAIKVLRPDFAQEKRMAERFRSEIKLARKVRHKNVCTIHDYGDERGLLFISMELVEGTDLKHLLREHGALPPEQAYDIAIQAAEGLQAVHDAGIIHRDLKTPNIILDNRGVVRLLDFGIAKRGDGEGTTLTGTGQVMGTPEYMSPEQAQGHNVGFGADLYSLGIVAYELFTGHVPFRGETPISTILKHLHDPPPLEGPEAVSLPAALRPVLKRALAKRPEDRHPSAHAFAEALRLARRPSLKQQLASTAALQAPTVQVERTRTGHALWLGAALLLLGGALGVGAWLWQAGGERPTLAPQPDSAEQRLAPALPRSSPTPAEASPTPTSFPTPNILIAQSTSPPPLSAAAAPAALARAAPVGPGLGGALPARQSPPPAPRPTPNAALTSPVPLATSVPATPVPASPAPARSEEPGGAGLIQVSARPWGEVMLDGTLVGTTPLEKFPASAGTHMVRVRHPAYEPIERRVVVQPGRSERVFVDFTTEGVRKQ